MSKKISAMTALGAPPDAADYFVVVDASATTTKKVLMSSIMQLFAGLFVRPKFTWSDADTITITPGVYHHDGTVEQLVWWNSALTFDFGSGGSNAGSTDLGASEYHYLYIDDSSIGATGELTAAMFLNSTTAPSWSAAKHGWYNSNDRCILGVLTDGSNNILEFFHDGDYVMYADRITDRADADLDTTWTDVTLSIPGFATRAMCWFNVTSAGGSGEGLCQFRVNGQTGTVGHHAGGVEGTGDRSRVANMVITDSSQIFEVKCNVSDDTAVGIMTQGWYFPIGM